jgi:hypothetical protein
MLETEADYQRCLCGIALWSDEMPRALAGSMMSAFNTLVSEVPLPPLFEGRYELRITLLAPGSGGTIRWASAAGDFDQLRVPACVVELLPPLATLYPKSSSQRNEP